MTEFKKFYYGTRVVVAAGFNGKAFDAIVMQSHAAHSLGGDEIKQSSYMVLELRSQDQNLELDYGDYGLFTWQWVPEQLMEPVNYDYEYNQDVIDAYLLKHA
jgi:hypothetical protein